MPQQVLGLPPTTRSATTARGSGVPQSTRYQALGLRNLPYIASRYPLPESLLRGIEVVGQVLPFRVNAYVLEHLIDWERVEDDGMSHLLFPRSGMLTMVDEQRIAAAVDAGDQATLRAVVAEVRAGLNPHPSGQREHNVPNLCGERMPGVQHKYQRTVLYFPAHGQTCHSYCTYCFRWAQFVGDAALKFSAPNPSQLVSYLREHGDVTDVLITGGDPAIMSTERLRSHLEPLLDVPTITTVRIGTKSLAYWPQRFVTDDDADDLLRLIDSITAGGRTLAVMAHVSHPRELESELARTAIRRLRDAGAVIYCQAPLIARVNDDPALWAQMWASELRLGAVPYYLFVERDTGPHEYFKVPLVRAYKIFQQAYTQLPGLARTVRGPVMSATPGKVGIDGVVERDGQRYLQLSLRQCRDASLVGQPFEALYDAEASWLSELTLAPHTPAHLVAAVAPYTAGPR